MTDVSGKWWHGVMTMSMSAGFHLDFPVGNPFATAIIKHPFAESPLNDHQQPIIICNAEADERLQCELRMSALTRELEECTVEPIKEQMDDI